MPYEREQTYTIRHGSRARSTRYDHYASIRNVTNAHHRSTHGTTRHQMRIPNSLAHTIPMQEKAKHLEQNQKQAPGGRKTKSFSFVKVYVKNSI